MGDHVFKEAWERVAVLSLAIICLTAITIAYSPQVDPGKLPIFLSQRAKKTTSQACQGAANTAGGQDPWGNCWPGSWNTGVPVGTSLSSYGGSCTVSVDNTTIDSKTVNCPSGMSIQANNVTISNSLVNGNIRLETDNVPSSLNWSMTIVDSEVDAGTLQIAVICCGNSTVTRTNMHGGVTGLQCEELASKPCRMTDSYIHGQYIPDDQPWHLGGFLSDGSSAGIYLTHNMVVCDHLVNSVGEGCSGDINFIPNFAAISGATVYRNLLGANPGVGTPYCTLGGEKASSSFPHSDHIAYTDNVFQRGNSGVCGDFGPWTDWDVTQPGNSWTNNRYDDGTIIPGT